MLLIDLYVSIFPCKKKKKKCGVCIPELRLRGFVYSIRVCVRVCVWGGLGEAISKGANSLVDRNCDGLEVEPLAAVMQVEPCKPHQSQQRYNEAEAANAAAPAPMRLLLPGQRQAQLGRQHAECQTGSVGQARGAGATSR